MSTEFAESTPAASKTLEELWQARVSLSYQMAEIMADPARYNSTEFDTCVRGITEANRRFREKQWEEYSSDT